MAAPPPWSRSAPSQIRNHSPSNYTVWPKIVFCFTLPSFSLFSIELVCNFSHLCAPYIHLGYHLPPLPSIPFPACLPSPPIELLLVELSAQNFEFLTTIFSFGLLEKSSRLPLSSPQVSSHLIYPHESLQVAPLSVFSFFQRTQTRPIKFIPPPKKFFANIFFLPVISFSGPSAPFLTSPSPWPHRATRNPQPPLSFPNTPKPPLEWCSKHSRYQTCRQPGFSATSKQLLQSQKPPRVAFQFILIAQNRLTPPGPPS